MWPGSQTQVRPQHARLLAQKPWGGAQLYPPSGLASERALATAGHLGWGPGGASKLRRRHLVVCLLPFVAPYTDPGHLPAGPIRCEQRGRTPPGSLLTGSGVPSLPSGFFAYTCGCLVVVEDLHSGAQRHWLGHPEEVSTLALSHDAQVLASRPTLCPRGPSGCQGLDPWEPGAGAGAQGGPWTPVSGLTACPLPCPPDPGLRLRLRQHSLPLPDPHLGRARGLLPAAHLLPQHRGASPGFFAR